MILRNVTLQARLIDDLLDFNRIATGKLAISPAPMDVHELLRLPRRPPWELESKGLTATCNLRAASGRIVADPVRIEQVFGNVLRNAIKFTASGTIDIETTDVAATTGSAVHPRSLPRHGSRP